MRLERLYPDATTALHHENPFQLLVAVILSAQCTDARVNMVTPALFAAFPTPADLARAPRRDLERMIHSCGFFRSKARHLIGAAKMLVERFGGRVPQTREELLQLPGVGRKTANVILSTAFGQGAIAVDTHVFRVANRLRLVRAMTPAAVERGLLRSVPRELWGRISHWLILHGRRVCTARRPACARCVLADLCPSAGRFYDGRKKDGLKSARRTMARSARRRSRVPSP